MQLNPPYKDLYRNYFTTWREYIGQYQDYLIITNAHGYLKVQLNTKHHVPIDWVRL